MSAIASDPREQADLDFDIDAAPLEDGDIDFSVMASAEGQAVDELDIVEPDLEEANLEGQNLEEQNLEEQNLEEPNLEESKPDEIDEIDYDDTPFEMYQSDADKGPRNSHDVADDSNEGNGDNYGDDGNLFDDGEHSKVAAQFYEDNVEDNMEDNMEEDVEEEDDDEVGNTSLVSTPYSVDAEADFGVDLTHFQAAADNDATVTIDEDGRNHADESSTPPDVAVNWAHEVCPLFKKADTDAPGSYYLEDTALVDRPLAELLAKIRDSIEEWVEASDELILRIEELDIAFAETTTGAILEQFTFGQILGLFNSLASNDGHASAPTMHITITTRANCGKRIQQLVQAANEGRGLASIQHEGSTYVSPHVETDPASDSASPVEAQLEQDEAEEVYTEATHDDAGSEVIDLTSEGHGDAESEVIDLTGHPELDNAYDDAQHLLQDEADDGSLQNLNEGFDVELFQTGLDGLQKTESLDDGQDDDDLHYVDLEKGATTYEEPEGLAHTEDAGEQIYEDHGLGQYADGQLHGEANLQEAETGEADFSANDPGEMETGAVNTNGNDLYAGNSTAENDYVEIDPGEHGQDYTSVSNTLSGEEVDMSELAQVESEVAPDALKSLAASQTASNVANNDDFDEIDWEEDDEPIVPQAQISTPSSTTGKRGREIEDGEDLAAEPDVKRHRA